MEINKRNRTELKGYFVKNAIPTENNFSDLVDAALVQKDDGIVKLAGTPLSVEATGDDASQKDVLALYRSFSESNAAWRVSLNPRSDPNNPQTAKSGFGISDAGGNNRLFIDASTGYVGIGTNSPTARLHTLADSTVGVLESTTTAAWLRVQTSEGASNRVELCNRSGGNLALWVGGGGDSLRIRRDGRVGIGMDADRTLSVGRDGTVSLLGNVGLNSSAGLYWANTESYSIRRGSGAWNAPDYQQLILKWHTGIVMEPGTGNNAGYGRSFVEVRGGKGLRVSEGTVAIGPTDPGTAKLRISNSSSDFADFYFAAGGSGHLQIVGWASGWNINTMVDGKHLYINRDSGSSTDTLIGKAGRETIIKGSNGRVGILGQPGTHFHVHGNAWCGHMRADDGVTIGHGNLSSHIDVDGAFYRYSGQAYFVVDDNLYIRDMGGDIKFHFDTNLGVIRQDGWTNASFQNGWVNYGGSYNSAGFYRDRQGVVHLRGLVRSGATGNNATIFNLPAGYRPPGRELRVVQTADAVGRVDIETNGRVIPYSVNNGWVSLDGISFRSV